MKKPSTIIKQLADKEFERVNGTPRKEGQEYREWDVIYGIVSYLDLPWYEKIWVRLQK